MAENPVLTIARLLGGLVLLQGRLGHQVLGQLLIANSNEVAIAGAAVVIAGTAGQQDAAAQIALRTAVPALAVRSLLLTKEQRLKRREKIVSEREIAAAATLKKRDEKIAAQARRIERQKGWIVERDQITAERDGCTAERERIATDRERIAGERDESVEAARILEAQLRGLTTTWNVATSTNAELERENRRLQEEIGELRKARVQLAGLDVGQSPRPAEVPREPAAKPPEQRPAKRTKTKRATRPKKPGKRKE